MRVGPPCNESSRRPEFRIVAGCAAYPPAAERSLRWVPIFDACIPVGMAVLLAEATLLSGIDFVSRETVRRAGAL